MSEQGTEWKNQEKLILTTREAKKAIKHYLENSVVQIEMARMRRERKVSLEFEKKFSLTIIEFIGKHLMENNLLLIFNLNKTK